LRKAGVDGDIIGFLGSNQYDALIDLNLSPVVFDPDNIREISRRAQKRKISIGVHLKIDVGMGRIGVMPEGVDSLLGLIDELPGVELRGVLGHLPVADSAVDDEKTVSQAALFEHLAAEKTSRQGVAMHLANSAGAIRFPAARYDMVRPGIALYGCYPSADAAISDGLRLQPVMSFSTRIIQVKDVPGGYGVSYGHLFVTEKPSRLAILPVGYADGYLRSLTNRAEVLIKGRRAPVCGRVCMNAVIVDVSGIDGVAAGDEAVLLGRQQFEGVTGEITADEVASWMGTISYEVLCLFGNSNDRVYV